MAATRAAPPSAVRVYSHYTLVILPRQLGTPPLFFEFQLLRNLLPVQPEAHVPDTCHHHAMEGPDIQFHYPTRLEETAQR